MNSRQRRSYKRYILRKLDILIQNGKDNGQEGCYEYDLPNTNQKMYIDFPVDGDLDVSYIYVSLPFAHIINSSMNKGRYVMLFDSTDLSNSIEEMSFTKKMSLSDETKLDYSRNYFPKFIIDIEEDYKLCMFADNKSVKILELKDGETRDVTFEEVFTNEKIPSSIRKKMAFHIDILKVDTP